jgi:hypothetical protein
VACPLICLLLGRGLGLTEADESDLRIVRKIIEAAIWYTTAEKVEIQPEAES